MRHFDATKDELAAGGEGMDVEPGADAWQEGGEQWGGHRGPNLGCGGLIRPARLRVNRLILYLPKLWAITRD